jgi:hypothetical protein
LIERLENMHKRAGMTLTLGHLTEEQRKILRAVVLAYRRVMRAPVDPAATRAEISQRDQKRQAEALAAATAEYRRLSPYGPATSSQSRARLTG